MFAVILLPPLLFAVVGGLGVSILAVGFLGQRSRGSAKTTCFVSWGSVLVLLSGCY